MTDIEGFLTIYGHSDNLLNNNYGYTVRLFVLFVCLFVCLFYVDGLLK